MTFTIEIATAGDGIPLVERIRTSTEELTAVFRSVKGERGITARLDGPSGGVVISSEWHFRTLSSTNLVATAGVTIGGAIIDGQGQIEFGLSDVLSAPTLFLGPVIVNQKGQVTDGLPLPLPLPRLMRPTPNGATAPIGFSLATNGTIEVESIAASLPETLRGLRSLASGPGITITAGPPPSTLAPNVSIAADATHANSLLYISAHISRIENTAGTGVPVLVDTVESQRAMNRIHPVRRIIGGRNIQTTFDASAIYVAAANIPFYRDLVVAFTPEGDAEPQTLQFTLPAAFPSISASSPVVNVSLNNNTLTLQVENDAAHVPFHDVIAWRVSNAGLEEVKIHSPTYTIARTFPQGGVVIRNLTADSVSVEDAETLRLRFVFV